MALRQRETENKWLPLKRNVDNTTGVFGIYNYGNHWPLYYIYIYLYGNNKLQEGKWVNQHCIKIWLGITALRCARLVLPLGW